jgi:hypothetical protein
LARFPELTCCAVQGHTGDPVKDLEAKLKFIQEHVPTRISNVSGRHACAAVGRRLLEEAFTAADVANARRAQHCGLGLW